MWQGDTSDVFGDSDTQQVVGLTDDTFQIEDTPEEPARSPVRESVPPIRT